MIKLYNTLTKKKEIFKPIEENRVNIFVCGITAYDSPHLGHGRCAVFYDAFVKYLRNSSFEVFYLQNITDIDDKIIRRAQEKRTTPEKIAKEYEKEYMDGMKSLRVNSVSKYARATEHMKEVISQVKRLLDKKHAYIIDGDGIYFDIKKFENYGSLSGRSVLQAEDAVSRIDDTIGKKSKADFCLWKFSKPGESKWKSPWGEGRPGWHIEDTAIAEKYFGFQYDIHGGGRDLMFPHHEAEIAQMESISGKRPMVKYWVHLGFLTVDGTKMSKSLGNFTTISDFEKKNSDRLMRFFFLKTHYRSPIDYSENNLSQTKKELEKFDDFLKKIENIKDKIQTKNNLTEKIIEKSRKDFYKSMDDDMNTPSAIAAIFKLMNQINSLLAQEKISHQEAKEIVDFLKKVDVFLDFIFWREKPTADIPETIKDLVKEREVARLDNDWKRADEIRKKLEKKGYKVEDIKKGTIIKKI